MRLADAQHHRTATVLLASRRTRQPVSHIPWSGAAATAPQRDEPLMPPPPQPMHRHLVEQNRPRMRLDDPRRPVSLGPGSSVAKTTSLLLTNDAGESRNKRPGGGGGGGDEDAVNAATQNVKTWEGCVNNGSLAPQAGGCRQAKQVRTCVRRSPFRHAAYAAGRHHISLRGQVAVCAGALRLRVARACCKTLPRASGQQRSRCPRVPRVRRVRGEPDSFL